jgi:hypothetical protein
LVPAVPAGMKVCLSAGAQIRRIDHRPQQFIIRKV